MIAYQYDHKGYFAGAVEDYGFAPNNSTYDPAPEKEGYIARRTGAGWQLVENHKGEKGYLGGAPFMIKDYGPYPEGFSSVEPDPSAEEVNNRKIAEIKYRLQELDSASIRPLRAMAEGKATAEDTQKLTELDAEAESLREELRRLEA